MILALDIGTSSCRAAVFGEDGTRILGSLEQLAYRVETGPEGKAVLDPNELVVAARHCAESARNRVGAIEAVGMSCFWHSLLGLDDAGRPLTPIYTWADARCRFDAEALRSEIDEREVHAETGCMLRASFWPAKLRWLKRTEPDLFSSVARWISPAEWVRSQFTGSMTCAVGMATGTGLFDPTALRWSKRMLDVCGVRLDQLSRVSDEPDDWGGARFFPGIGDGAASNLGSGATRPGRAAINFGTSAALRVMRDGVEARAPYGLFAYRVDDRRFLTGGAVSNAGNLFAWCRRELQLPGDDATESALSARETPEHGLTVLPFWNAERAPRWNEDDTGAVIGIRQATTALDLTQAIQEATFYRLAAIAEAMGRPDETKWIVSGGILNSGSALRRLASVLGSPVFANPEPEASLRGAAVFALEKLGIEVPTQEEALAVPPDAEVHARYAEERARQSKLEALLDDWR
ncbi:MAG: gluconokinase [Chthoniobacterales bacterium]